MSKGGREGASELEEREAIKTDEFHAYTQNRPLEAVDVLGQMEREEFGPRVKAGLASYNAGLKVNIYV